MKIESIAIIGTGVIGSSWAAFYAAKGFQVKMWDVDAGRCQKGHQQAVDIIRLLRAQGVVSGDQVEESISRIASVEDVDKAVSAGPGLRWAVMGPHMIYHLGGGEGGMDHFIDHFAPAVKVWWESLATWTTLPPEAKAMLVDGLKAEMRDRTLSDMNRRRDEKLIKMLKILYE